MKVLNITSIVTDCPKGPKLNKKHEHRVMNRDQEPAQKCEEQSMR